MFGPPARVRDEVHACRCLVRRLVSLAWWRVTRGICSSLSWGPLDVVKPLHIAFSVFWLSIMLLHFISITCIILFSMVLLVLGFWPSMCMNTIFYIWTACIEGVKATTPLHCMMRIPFYPTANPLWDVSFFGAVSPEFHMLTVVVLLYVRWGLSIISWWNQRKTILGGWTGTGLCYGLRLLNQLLDACPRVPTTVFFQETCDNCYSSCVNASSSIDFVT